MNLKMVSVGFDNYAADTNGELPTLVAPTNKNWLHGNTETGAKNNAANLLPLVTGNYVQVKALYCAGAGGPRGSEATGRNEMPEIDYSYRNLWGPERPVWDHARETIVLADKNPVLGLDARPGTETRNSANHDGRGQYVVRADGSVTWEVSPNIGPAGDNIWTLGTGRNQVLTYTGTEVPASLSDVFVCP
jgi:hypothetical protein